MRALFFILLGVFLFGLVIRAVRSGEIPAKGYGFKMRLYERDGEPLLYWVNFGVYLVTAIVATGLGWMEWLGRP